MKKLVLALSIASLFAAPVMAEEIGEVDDVVSPVQPLPENQGVVSFNGMIQAKTCKIKAAHKNQNVTLPTLDVEVVQNKTKTGKTDFQIDLEGCTNYVSTSEEALNIVALTFTPSEDQLETVGNDKVLKNRAFTVGSGNQGAGNVGLKVTNEKNLNVLNNEYQFASLNPVVTDPSFKFSVEYIKLNGGDVTPGLVNAALPFTVTYK